MKKGRFRFKNSTDDCDSEAKGWEKNLLIGFAKKIMAKRKIMLAISPNPNQVGI